MACPTCQGSIPGDQVISVELFAGDSVPQMIEITYADGERLILRAMNRWSPRDVRTLKGLVR